MSLPFISILITSYNREKYIAESIESALASVYTDFELLVTDNCSTDNTFDIAKRYEKVDSRVRVYRNKENIGQFRNRNLVASYAKGEYLKYLDSDDLIYPYGLSILIKAALLYPQAGLIASVDAEEAKPYPIEIEPEEAYKKYFLIGGFPSVGPTDTLIKRKAFERVNGFSIPSFAGTDIELSLKIAAIYSIVKAEAGVSWYRVHDGQEINNAKRNYEYQFNIYNCLYQLLQDPNCPLNKNDINLAILKLRRSCLREGIRFASHLNMNIAYKLIRNLNPTLREFCNVILR